MRQYGRPMTRARTARGAREGGVMGRKRADIKFKGWDWTEMLAIWPKRSWPKDTNANPFAREEAQLAWLKERIAEFPAMAPLKEWDPMLAWRYRQVRRYAKACAKASGHTGGSILLAIADAECDYAFLSWFRLDIGAWWT